MSRVRIVAICSSCVKYLSTIVFWSLAAGGVSAQSIPYPGDDVISQLPMACQYMVGVIEREYRNDCPDYGFACSDAGGLDRLWDSLSGWVDVAEKGGCSYPNPYTNSLSLGESPSEVIVQEDNSSQQDNSSPSNSQLQQELEDARASAAAVQAELDKEMTEGERTLAQSQRSGAANNPALNPFGSPATSTSGSTIGTAPRCALTDVNGAPCVSGCSTQKVAIYSNLRCSNSCGWAMQVNASVTNRDGTKRRYGTLPANRSNGIPIQSYAESEFSDVSYQCP